MIRLELTTSSTHAAVSSSAITCTTITDWSSSAITAGRRSRVSVAAWIHLAIHAAPIPSVVVTRRPGG